MKARLLLLTPDDGFLAHLKKVDKGRIALDQLSGLKEKEKEEEKGWEGQGQRFKYISTDLLLTQDFTFHSTKPPKSAINNRPTSAAKTAPACLSEKSAPPHTVQISNDENKIPSAG